MKKYIFLLATMFVTNSLNLLSVVADYRHMQVNGKDVYLLEDYPFKCKTGQFEARELLHYLFSDQTYANNVAFIYQDNDFCAKNDFSRSDEDSLVKDWSDYVSCELIKSVNKVNMLDTVRTICYFNPSKLNPQVSAIPGDARGPELLKKIMDASIGRNLSEAMKSEILSVSRSCIRMLDDDRFTQEFKEKNEKILEKYIYDICTFLRLSKSVSIDSKWSDEKCAKCERAYRNVIYDLTNFYFYIQIHFYALSYDKVVLYAGADYTRYVCHMLLQDGAVLVNHVNPHQEFIKSLVIDKDFSEVVNGIDFDQNSIISEFLPEIFGVTINPCNSIEFLCNLFGNKYVSDLK